MCRSTVRLNDRGAMGSTDVLTELWAEMWADLEGGQRFAAPELWNDSATMTSVRGRAREEMELHILFSWVDIPSTLPTGLLIDTRTADQRQRQAHWKFGSYLGQLTFTVPAGALAVYLPILLLV